MAEKRDRPRKSLKDQIEELWQDVLDALESLVTPEPSYVPVPVRDRGRRYPPRRR